MKVVGTDLFPVLEGEGGKGQDVVGRVEQAGRRVQKPGLGESTCDLGQLAQVLSRAARRWIALT